MGKYFSVETRSACKVCGAKITNKRSRTYCSAKCRNKVYNERYYDLRQDQARERRGRKAEGKFQCLICGKWYYQVCSHVWLTHGVGEEDYKKMFDLPLSKGILPVEIKRIKAEHVFENGTIENLKKGVKKRYRKGDPRAKAVTGWKGRRGNKGFEEY